VNRNWGALGSLCVAACGIAAVPGCGNTDPRFDPKGTEPILPLPPATTDSARFARNFANAFCDNIAKCCAAAVRQFIPDYCKYNVATGVYVGSPGEQAVFNPDAAPPCLVAIREATSACNDRTLWLKAEAICTTITKGLVSRGGACIRNEECARLPDEPVSCIAGYCALNLFPNILGYDKLGKLGDLCGATCADYGREGGRCSGTLSSNLRGLPEAELRAIAQTACLVSDGLVCSSEGVCAPPPARGTACNGGGFCALGDHCSRDGCAPPIPTGSAEPCANVDPACESSAFCDRYDTGRCLPKKSNGQSCGRSSECLNDHCIDGHCRDWSVAFSDTCDGKLDFGQVSNQ